MEKPTGLIDFITTKEIILKEISNSFQDSRIKMPEILVEKNNEIRINFSVSPITPDLLMGAVKVIRGHIENLRINTFEEGYFSIQALNENVFDTKNILDNIRFRFLMYRESTKVEIVKKGDYSHSEIYAVIGLFKQLNSSSIKRTVDPKEVLLKLGVSVFDPTEAKNTHQWMDFEYIAGYDTVKREIVEAIIMPLKSPGTYDEVSKLTRKFPGKNRPRAVLFEGDPGVGKTTMAKIVSCLTGIPMIYVPIESILSKYYGESSQNLAYVFDAAALFPESLLFLDEIDSLAGSREEGMFEATRKLLSVLLRKLDGFEGSSRTITIGATNRKQDLDHALISRFDKSIYFPLPNKQERSAILGNYAIHLSELQKESISELIDGMSGRNIKDFCDHVERKWATNIIENNLDTCPPPFDTYIETCKLSKRSL